MPMEATAKVGDTVTWTNTDAIAHTVTKDAGPGPDFDSGTIAAGKSYEETFEEAGTIEYLCTIHAEPDGHPDGRVAAPSAAGAQAEAAQQQERPLPDAAAAGQQAELDARPRRGRRSPGRGARGRPRARRSARRGAASARPLAGSAVERAALGAREAPGQAARSRPARRPGPRPARAGRWGRPATGRAAWAITASTPASGPARDGILVVHVPHAAGAQERGAAALPGGRPALGQRSSRRAHVSSGTPSVGVEASA